MKEKYGLLALTVLLFLFQPPAAGQTTSGDDANAPAKADGQPCDPPVAKLPVDEEYDESISQRMKSLFDADQSARSASPIDWTKLSVADRQRRVEVMAYLQQGVIHTADDLFYAAMIFQHGNCPEHYKLANQLAEKAMDKGSERARWLYAASLDRYLMSQQKPQKFGTQYQSQNGKWRLYPVDPQTTDEERRRYNVPSLAAAKERVEKMNAQHK